MSRDAAGADLTLGTTMQELVTSWVTVGALVGALLAGCLANIADALLSSDGLWR